MNIQSTENTAVEGNHHDAEYHGFLARMQQRFEDNIGGGSEPLFTTDADNLWGLYLSSFVDPVERQFHNCHACHQFVERFGSLVTIDASGMTTPAIWHADDAPDVYRPAVLAVAKTVRRAKVSGVFLSSHPVWGTPETGEWRHMSVTPPAAILYRRATLTAGQSMSEKREEFGVVTRALAEFTQSHVETALALLNSDALYRSEKVLGQAEWLAQLHRAIEAAHGSRKTDVVWLAVAKAPAGFCHPRSSMIGTLLDDIAAGKDFAEVSRAFAAKMHPLAYQRPQAAPTVGAIAAAEKIIEQIGAAGSLARRFARIDEVEALWRPKAKQATPVATDGSVFGHLKAKVSDSPSSMAIPAQTMTWEKFARTVLPTATRIKMRAPERSGYVALVTAVNPEAPPILQWDREDARNPVSWYFWHGGSTAESFGLVAGRLVDVEAIALKPSMWNGGNEHQGAGVMFVLEGARESRSAGAALFPEILKSEFHGIRSVLEAYSRGATIEGMHEPHAAGLMKQNGDARWNVRLSVWSEQGPAMEYCLDRWD